MPPRTCPVLPPDEANGYRCKGQFPPRHALIEVDDEGDRNEKSPEQEHGGYESKVPGGQERPLDEVEEDEPAY